MAPIRSAATGEWRGSKNGWPGGQYPQNIYTEPKKVGQNKVPLTVSMYVFERF